MLKVSAFYLEKKIFLKKCNLGRSLYIGQESSNRWRFAVPIFREDFECAYTGAQTETAGLHAHTGSSINVIN